MSLHARTILQDPPGIDASGRSAAAGGMTLHRSIGTAVGVAFAAALLACSPGDRGALEPVGGPNVALVDTHGLPGDTARLVAGGTTADVTGAWSKTRETIEIAYRTGAMPATIALTSAVRWQGQATPASHRWDRTTRDPGNALGRPLPAAMPLRLRANDRRVVVIEYDRVPAGVGPAQGDRLTIAVPLPGGGIPVDFRLGAP